MKSLSILGNKYAKLKLEKNMVKTDQIRAK